VCHGHDAGNDGAVIGIARDVPDKGNIDLEVVQRQIFEMA